MSVTNAGGLTHATQSGVTSPSGNAFKTGSGLQSPSHASIDMSLNSTQFNRLINKKRSVEAGWNKKTFNDI